MGVRPPARRSLLKGALAAPVILTVCPAPALARATGLACMVRDAQKAEIPPTPAPMVSSDSDDWVRLRVDMMELSVFEGAKLKKIEGKYFLGVDKATYWQVQDLDPQRIFVSPTSYTVHNVAARRTGESKYALLHIDSDLQEAGFAMERRGGNPITLSCWTSVGRARAA
jgi:hypothetical protein